MKAVVITLDGLIGLVFFITCIFIVLPMVAGLHASILQTAYLKSLSMDVLTVLGESGRAQNLVVDSNISSVQSLLEVTPSSVCMDLTLINMSSQETMAAVRKSSCGEASQGFQIAYLSFNSARQNYMMVARSWLR